MPTVYGEHLAQQGVYFMLDDGFWVKQEAAGLWSGPYKTADGSAFSQAGSGGGGGGTAGQAASLWSLFILHQLKAS